MTVSIHVPARGTTNSSNGHVSDMEVSIHVPARGTTKSLFAFVSPDVFQSTFPQGERRSFIAMSPSRACFNPRSRKGNDLLPCIMPSHMYLFQSTFPQGERLETCGLFKAEKLFQSTFPQGERPEGQAMAAKVSAFQSTFPQGERRR